MTVRFFTFNQYHNKNAGSTRLRVQQLLDHWPEAALYKYGENPDAIVFQKVYTQPDWKFMEHFEGTKVLDICDPDWLDGVEVKKTLDAVDGATCPTQALADFLRQLTDKPIKVIPDRHDLALFPQQATHSGDLKSVVWFGYKHNAAALRWAMNFLVRNKLKLTVVSNDDPMPYQWADDPEAAQSPYSFVGFDEDELNAELVKHDAALLPVGGRPVDRFKSNNRTIIAHLSGLPVITDADSFERYKDPENRKLDSATNLAQAKEEYNVTKSVEEVKAFIEELRSDK